MTDRQWGRLQADVDCRLRRGAWYRVLRVEPLEAIVEVNRKPLPVPKYLLEFVSHPPRRWTIVPTTRNAARHAAHLGPAYAVCPSCRNRVALRGKPRRMLCVTCRTEFDVAWDEAYLENV
ncbi:MAG: hypothetical protein ACREL9_08965 [Gemmatimonadales bacterium]